MKNSKLMKRLIILIAWITMVALPGCYYHGPCIEGSGAVIIEARPPTEFVAVTSTGSFEVYVTQSDSFHVEVEARENLLQIIETYVSGHTLIIKTKDGTCFKSGAPVVVYVSMPEIEVLNLTGSGKMEATITGSGDIIYRGNPAISLIATGSGSLRPY